MRDSEIDFESEETTSLWHDSRRWYSDEDAVKLLRIIRASCLSYTEDSEDYLSTKENTQRVYIADLCAGGFETFLDQDINLIVTTWSNMPTILVLTFLSGAHFRAARVCINYEDKKVDILWDDPYGEGHFSQHLKEEVRSCIQTNIVKLINKQGAAADRTAAEIEISEKEKIFDQQGVGKNWWDCGPIIFSNVKDYVSLYTKTNEGFQRKGIRFTYSVPQYTTTSAQIIKGIRSNHLTAIGNIEELTEKERSLVENIKAHKKSYNPSRSDINKKIEGLDANQIELLFAIIESSNIGKGLSPSQLDKFIKQVITGRSVEEIEEEERYGEFIKTLQSLGDLQKLGNVEDTELLEMLKSTDWYKNLESSTEAGVLSIAEAKAQELIVLYKKSLRPVQKRLLDAIDSTATTVKFLEMSLSESDAGSNYTPSSDADISTREIHDTPASRVKRVKELKERYQQLQQQPHLARLLDKNVMVRIHVDASGEIGTNQTLFKRDEKVQIMGRAAVSEGNGRQMRHVTPVAFVEHMVKNSVNRILDENGDVLDVIKFLLDKIDLFVEVNDKGIVLNLEEFKSLNLPTNTTVGRVIHGDTEYIFIDEKTKNTLIRKNPDCEAIFDAIPDTDTRLGSWNKEKKERIILTLFDSYLKYLDHGRVKEGVEYLCQQIITEFNNCPGAAFPTEGNTCNYEIRIYPKPQPRGKAHYSVVTPENIKTVISTYPGSYEIRKVNSEGADIRQAMETLQSAEKQITAAEEEVVSAIANVLFLTFDYKHLEDKVFAVSASGEYRILQGASGTSAKDYTIEDGNVVRRAEIEANLSNYTSDVLWRSSVLDNNLAFTAKLMRRHLVLVFLAYPELLKLHDKIIHQFTEAVAEDFSLSLVNKAQLINFIEAEMAKIDLTGQEESSFVSSDSAYYSTPRSGSISTTTEDRTSSEANTERPSKKPRPGSFRDPGVEEHKGVEEDYEDTSHEQDSDSNNLRRSERLTLGSKTHHFNLRETLFSCQIEQGSETLANLISVSKKEMQNRLVPSSSQPANYVGRVNILSDTHHRITHNNLTTELISRINENLIDSDTVICLERKERGNNLGMEDVILISKILEHNTGARKEDLIIIPETIKNSAIYHDALLYQAACTKNIRVIGVEGKGLAHGKESPYYNHEREIHITETIKEQVNCGKDVIMVIGSNHVTSIQENLVAEHIEVNVENRYKSNIETLVSRLVSNHQISRGEFERKDSLPVRNSNVPHHNSRG